jgi:hypothetical protein
MNIWGNLQSYFEIHVPNLDDIENLARQISLLKIG